MSAERACHNLQLSVHPHLTSILPTGGPAAGGAVLQDISNDPAHGGKQLSPHKEAVETAESVIEAAHALESQNDSRGAMQAVCDAIVRRVQPLHKLEQCVALLYDPLAVLDSACLSKVDYPCWRCQF